MDVVSVGYRSDLAIRVAEGGQITDCGDHLVLRTTQNPAYWWGNFILLGQPPPAGRQDAWLTRFAEIYPAAEHVAFGVDVTAPSAVDPALFASAGLRLEQHVVMTAASLREPPHPNRTARIRHLTGDADWQQAADLRLACSLADEPGEPGETGETPEFTERRTAARRRLAETGKGAWFGAFAGERLVAQLGLVPAGRGLARYQEVETHPGFRWQGLAGTLVWHAGRYGTDELGAATLVIVADPGYAAIRIYSSVGFARAEDQVGFVRSGKAQRAAAGSGQSD